MQPKWFSLFVGGGTEQKCLFDGSAVYTDMVEKAQFLAQSDPVGHYRLFLGKDRGKLVWDSADWRGVTC